MKAMFKVFVWLTIVLTTVIVAMLPFTAMVLVIRIVDYWFTVQQVMLLLALATIPSIYIATTFPKVICNFIWKESDEG